MATFCDTKWVSVDGSLAPDVTDTLVLPGSSAREDMEDEVPKEERSKNVMFVEPKLQAGSLGKSTKSALCIIPPENVWDQIQAIRSDYDKAYERWMPHINLLFPFVDDHNDGENFYEAACKIQSALSDLAPFTVHFSKQSLGYFLRKKSCTFWLQPLEEQYTKTSAVQPKDAKSSAVLPHHPLVMTIQKRVDNLFPECSDGSGEFHPHLSLGQFHSFKIRMTCENYRKTWTDFSFEVKEVHLISRVDFHDPFHMRHSVPLVVRK